ncbi:hypothetical protein U1Q18_018560 [Sarracenia purpurea var. burkii]
MKDVFQLIVSSFENLSDKSSRSYNKRTLILETVAKVRSCVVMLDLECDGLIVEMFQYFLKTIRDYHPDCVFSSMETIMTLVLEESEDIPPELISPILASVKMGNEEVLPIARKLGEKVFENCAIKLKPYLIDATKSLGLNLDEYSKVVASICSGTTGAVEHNTDNVSGEQLTEESKLAQACSDVAAQADENMLAVAPPDEAAEAEAEAEMTKENVIETRSEEDHPAEDKSPKLVMSNGVAETAHERRLADSESSKKLEDSQQVDQSVDNNVTINAEPDDPNSGKIVKSDTKTKQTSRKRGRKSKPLINSAEPSDSSRVGSDKEAERTAVRRKIHSKEVRSSPSEVPSIEVAGPSENEKENAQLSSTKALEDDPMNVVSPSPSGSGTIEGRLKKLGRPKKKDNSNLVQVVAQSVDVVPKKASEGTSNSEVKPQRRSGKKAIAGSNSEDKASALKDKPKSEGGTISDSEVKPLKQSVNKVDEGDDIADETLLKKEFRKRRGRGNVSSVKDEMDLQKPASKTAKVESHLVETPKISSKRKGTPMKDKAADTVEYGENLVDKKVKVWWPQDQTFYEGVIASFDPVKKKHKVLYTDGDLEVLNLRGETWELVEDDSISEGEQATEPGNPDPSPEIRRKKKGRTNSEPSAKQAKMEGSRGGEASSSKLKGTSTKSGRKSREDIKVDGKLKDNTFKSGGKSDEDTTGKSKVRSRKSGGKSVGDGSESAGKFKDVDGGSPKTNTKPKLDAPKPAAKDTPKTATIDAPKIAAKETPKTSAKDTAKTAAKDAPKVAAKDTAKPAAKDTPKSTTKDTPKTAGKSKNKSSKTGKRSSANGSGKGKSGSAKAKGTEGIEKSPETVKAPESSKALETLKGKSADTSKGQETDVKTGRKRRRGA